MQLARRGWYTCDPNPRVGCVISKDDTIIAEGWHVATGEAHAEIDALNKCRDAAGATVYLTLEPCSHHGRTPPCAEALIKAGVDTVIVAMPDPNPAVSGAGIKRLEQAGIKVRQGLLEAKARQLNPGFIKRMTASLPYARCKMAMSLDGRTALANGDSQWISSEPSRRDVHRLRAASSAVLSSVDTVLKDDPALNARDLDLAFKPAVRVIVDRKLKTPAHARLFRIPGSVLIYTENENQDRINKLTSAEVDIICLPRSETWLRHVFSHLATTFKINEILIEAGATFAGALLEQGLIDELIIYMAPMLLGSDAAPLLKLQPLGKLIDARQLDIIDVSHVGKDLRLTLTPKG